MFVYENPLIDPPPPPIQHDDKYLFQRFLIFEFNHYSGRLTSSDDNAF